MHVPNNWKMSDIGSFVTHKKGFAFQSSSFNSEKGRRVIRVSDTSANSIKTDNPIYIAETEASQYKDYELHSGDIILTTVGSRPPMYDSMVGKVIKVPDSIDGALLNQNMVKLKPIVSIIEPDYLYSLLKTKRFIFYIEKSVRGNANQVSITLDDIFNFPVLLPSLPEQQKIAQILATWDKAIEKLEALIAAKQKRKKALMQQLLTGKKRFAGFEGEWKKVSLSKLGKCIRGVSYKPDQILSIDTDDSIRLLRSTNIQNGSLNDKDLVIIPSSLVKDSQILKEGDLAVCMANGSKSLVGKSASFKIQKSKYTVGAFCAVFRPNQGANNELIKFLFESDTYSKELTILLSGSSINNLKGSDVEGIKFYIPDDQDEQQKIASVLSAADTEIETHQKQLAALKEQKKGLMQQLLTGKKRVKVDRPCFNASTN